MKVALVQDWLTEIGGAEKVFECFMELFPKADIYTLISHDRVINDLRIDKTKLKESFIADLPFGRSKYRNYLPLFPKAIESFDFSGYDLIISSSSSVAKGVLTNSKQLHICYCHSPVRYAWDLYHQYLKESKLNGFGIKKWLVRHTLHKLRIWDVISANRVDHYVANSYYIRRRINKVYRRESEVVYPPVDINRFELCEDKEEYYYTASRLVPYKKINLIVEAFSNMPDKRLVVAGMGPDFKKIKALAAPNIEMKGFVSNEEMLSLMKKAKAFVFAADEDFGIIPVEAQACGTPVIALSKGGTKETVVDRISGIHFNEQSADSIKEAIDKFEKTSFDPKKIRENAERFSKGRFKDEMKTYINKKIEEFKHA
ncbi:glycosyltransferase family 4 protein [Plebeiibacterium marinum]|uniref:Glycosyltransferase family 4 protein n=1 Tax=Plebeiibacterium marinum TaxID=2992111 RepID=A0AAE3MD99_9BACT|nr:glycosyltransferase family 4 protein [Plebeiobacterium marinum]MCW3805818.1 glycosyltransferase family 4 protein [Plebeiobacterium marinum]